MELTVDDDTRRAVQEAEVRIRASSRLERRRKLAERILVSGVGSWLHELEPGRSTHLLSDTVAGRAVKLADALISCLDEDEL